MKYTPLDSNDISWIHQRCSYKQKQIRNVIKGNWNHQHIQEKILIWCHHQNPGPSYILIEDSFDFTDADTDGEEIPETELCCLCRQFTPNKIRLGVDIELTNESSVTIIDVNTGHIWNIVLIWDLHKLWGYRIEISNISFFLLVGSFCLNFDFLTVQLFTFWT